MRQIGKHQFPSHGNVAECDAWQPYIRTHALARRVLVVATTRIEGTWKAYCDAVPGANHDEEWHEVTRVGCKVSEPVARAMFPEFEGVPYAK